MTDAGYKASEEYVRGTGGSRWGRSRILLVGVLGALVMLAVGVIFSAYAAGQGAAPVQGESFTHPPGTKVVEGDQYSGGEALKITSGQALPTKRVTITETSNVLVRAHAGQKGGSPTLTIRVDGSNAGMRRITSNALSNYLYSGIILEPGTYTIGLKGGNLAEGRYVFVDVLRFPTVTSPNNPPVGVDDSATVEEDSDPMPIDVLANDTDGDGDPLTIASVSNPAHGTAVVESGKVNYTPAENYDGPDEFTYQVSDGNGGTDTATVSITVNSVDDPPVAEDDSATTPEDTAVTIDVLDNDTDGGDGGTKTVESVTQPADGTVTITGGGSGLTYEPDPNYCNDGSPTDDFTYKLNGGSEAKVSVTVTCVEDDPVAVDDTKTVAEDDPATTIDVLANDTDPDGGTKTIESVTQPANGTVEITNNGNDLTYKPNADYCNDQGNEPDDTFTYTLNGGSTANVEVTVTCVEDDPVAVNDSATVDEDSEANAIDVLANVTDPDGGTMIIESVTQPANGTVEITNGGSDLTYTPNADYCNENSQPDTFTYTLNGGSTANVEVTVTCVEDDPVAVNDSATKAEDSGATAIDVLANDTDVDGGSKTIDSVTQPANGTVVITNGGADLTYEPDANYCNDPPATNLDTFTYILSPGTSQGSVSIKVTCVNDAPTARNEAFNGAIHNTSFVVDDPSDAAPNVGGAKKTITGDVLSNDSDVETPGSISVVANTNITSTNGGKVAIEADGDFTYVSDPNDNCSPNTDSFNYTLTDNDPGGAQTAQGTVTINLSGCVWYVDNDPAETGNAGTSADPFDALSSAQAKSVANQTVFVHKGTSSYTGGFNLDANERLIGEAINLVVGGDTLFTGTPANRPTLSGTVNLNSGNTISGVAIAGSGAPAISGGSGDNSGTIADVTLSGGSGGLDLNTTSGTWNLSDLTVNTSGGDAIRAASAGTVNFTSAGTISVTAAAGRGLNLSGTATSGTATSGVIDSTTVTSSANEGIKIDDDTGSLTLDDVNLTTTGTGLDIDSSNDVTVNSSGDADISSSGRALSLTTVTSNPANMPDVTLDQVSSTGGAAGINIDDIGNGTFSANGGTLSGHTGAEIDVNNGSGNVTYPGTIGNGSGLSAQITGRSGGTITLSGNINDTSDAGVAGGGIDMSSNSGGAAAIFSGATKTLNTGSSPAFSSTGSNPTITFSGGGLDIDTTSGAGFSATGGGTVNVTGANNTITTTTTGTALNVANTTIGASGLTFQSISSGNNTPAASDNPSNGIVLNNTGTSGGLTITGTGANNSGGLIQNTTGHGVSLTSTNNFNADELSITGANFAGVDGTDVTNFTFTDGEILNAGDSLTNPLHGSIAFNDQAANENNIDGTLVITGNILKDHYGGGVDVFNRSGTINDATVSNNTIDSPADEALSKEDAISFNLFGSASTVASLTKAQIEDNVITDHPSGNGIAFLGAQTNIGAAPVGTVGVPGSATNRILIDGNLLTGDPVNRFGGAAILAGVEGRGAGNFDITNNGTVASPITNVGTHAIATGNSGSSEVEYLIENNRISANNFEAGGGGIRSASDKHIMVGGTTLATPILKTIINNNHVRNTTGIGIRVLAGNSNGTANVKVTNNDVANGGAGSPPIDIGNGSSADAAFSHTMCATISGNTTAANAPSPGGNTFPGILLSKRFTTATQYPFGLTGLSPSPSTNANTEAYVTGLNPNASIGGGFYAGKRVAVNVGDNFTSCTHPAGF